MLYLKMSALRLSFYAFLTILIDLHLFIKFFWEIKDF